jgi:hypothetical protein
MNAYNLDLIHVMEACLDDLWNFCPEKATKRISDRVARIHRASRISVLIPVLEEAEPDYSLREALLKSKRLPIINSLKRSLQPNAFRAFHRLRIQYILQQNLGRLVYSEDKSRDERSCPEVQENRSAHSLIPPFRLTNRASGSEGSLCAKVYRRARDHLDRVRLSTFFGSAVQRITAANGSS